MSPNTRIYALFFAFSASLASLFFIPKWIVGDETGLAGGGIAGVAVLGILFVSAILALTVLVITIVTRDKTTIPAKVFGTLPLLVSVCLGLVLVIKMSQDVAQGQSSSGDPIPVTAPIDY
ncbi:hypothetical protein [Pelagicoccus sp. SDUM812002]|uniref:hypothetical protein n=1 Tax=Pelagicoccus sp. SDUM812002 TaxID=3041266 RepID=UPI00280F242F|nr:hypothetical protein [Pelagicoccus sp. SDUM812002]MDQ8185785.1 hypothetical protein [Pelagicoccus sp. SDUM812002]